MWTKNTKPAVINYQNVEIALGACWPMAHGTWQSLLQLKKPEKMEELYKGPFIQPHLMFQQLIDKSCHLERSRDWRLEH